MHRSDLVVIAIMTTGGLVGLLIGLLAGNARTFAGAGVMTGLVLGCLLTVLPPGRSGSDEAHGVGSADSHPGGAPRASRERPAVQGFQFLPLRYLFAVLARFSPTWLSCARTRRGRSNSPVGSHVQAEPSDPRRTFAPIPGESGRQ